MTKRIEETSTTIEYTGGFRRVLKLDLHMDAFKKILATGMFQSNNPLHISYSKAFELFGGVGGLELRIQKGEDGTCIFQDMTHCFCATTTLLRFWFGNGIFTVYEAANRWGRTYSRHKDFMQRFFSISSLGKAEKLRVTKQQKMVTLMRDICTAETGGFTPSESIVTSGYSYSFSMPTAAPSYIPYVIERTLTESVENNKTEERIE